MARDQLKDAMTVAKITAVKARLCDVFYEDGTDIAVAASAMLSMYCQIMRDFDNGEMIDKIEDIVARTAREKGFINEQQSS